MELAEKACEIPSEAVVVVVTEAEFVLLMEAELIFCPVTLVEIGKALT